MKKIFLTTSFFFLGLSVALLVAFFCFKNALETPKKNAESEFVFKIERGTTAKQVARILSEKGFVKNSRAFYLLARFPILGEFFFKNEGAQKKDFCVKSGVCVIRGGMSVAQIYKVLSNGVGEQIFVSVPEGLTITKIAEKMEGSGICSQKDFLQAAHDEEFLKTLNLPYVSAEGYLFPDTYSFSPGCGAKKCIEVMTKNFFEKTSAIKKFSLLSSAEKNRAVILASIIEREYRVADEAPLIASVFENRLKNNIGLYSCATVEYVITEILGRPHPKIITFEDLKIQSPYNTYLNAGLPPAPISNPGFVALNAAVHPAQSDYFYFRLMDEKEGRHVFTRTVQEHEEQTRIFKTKQRL